MATGYIRQSAGTIVNGNTIQASDFNNEFNLLQTFADATAGHTHDGTVGGGALISAASLSGLSSNGIVVRSSATTFTARTITGTAAEITVTNGDGVAGNPTLSLPTALTFTGKTITGGTFASGTWNGTLGAISGAALTNLTAANISAGTAGINITGNAATATTTSGNAATATALQTARTINGTSFNGTANITVTADASTLTGTSLNASVITSSLTTVGTIGTGVWQGTIVAGQYGGTGIANTGKTITIGGNFSTVGSFTTALTATANTAVTLPTTGTLATLAGVETLTNKTINGGTYDSLYVKQYISSTGIGSVRISMDVGDTGMAFRGATGQTAISYVNAAGSIVTNAAIYANALSYDFLYFNGGLGSTGVTAPVNIFANTGQTGIGIRTIANGQNAMAFVNAAGTGVGSITINAGATAFNTTSDYRVKSDLRSINKPALDTLMSIPVYSGVYNAEPDKRRLLFLAHEVQDYLPEAVTGVKDAIDEEGKPILQAVDYSKFVPALLAAIQELKLEIDSLRLQINN